MAPKWSLSSNARGECDFCRIFDDLMTDRMILRLYQCRLSNIVSYLTSNEARLSSATWDPRLFHARTHEKSATLLDECFVKYTQGVQSFSDFRLCNERFNGLTYSSVQFIGILQDMYVMSYQPRLTSATCVPRSVCLLCTDSELRVGGSIQSS